MGARTSDCEPNCGGLLGLESKVEGIVHTMIRLDKELNGNGQPGIRQDIVAIREALAGIAATSEQQLTQVTTQIGRKTMLWTIAGVSVSLAGVFVMILTIIVMVKLQGHSRIDIRKIIGSRDGQMYDAYRGFPPQNAINERTTQ